MFFKKKKTEERDRLTRAQKEELIKGLEDEHKTTCKKYAPAVYVCQSIALIFMALAIPEAVINKEWMFLVFISAAVVALLVPFIYMAFENEYWKQIKKAEQAEEIEEKPEENKENGSDAAE